MDDAANAIGKEFVQMGNGKDAHNALEDLNRVDVTKLDTDGIKAYSHALRSVGTLVNELEPEERRPNARVVDSESSDGYPVIE